MQRTPAPTKVRKAQAMKTAPVFAGANGPSTPSQGQRVVSKHPPASAARGKGGRREEASPEPTVPFSMISRPSDVSDMVVSPLTTPPRSRIRMPPPVDVNNKNNNNNNNNSSNSVHSGKGISASENNCRGAVERDRPQVVKTKTSERRHSDASSGNHSSKENVVPQGIPIRRGIIPAPSPVVTTQRKGVMQASAAAPVTSPNAERKREIMRSRSGAVNDLALPSTLEVDVRPSSSFGSTDSIDKREQMEAVMAYVESITAALSSRTRALPPPHSLDSFRHSIAPRSAAAAAATRQEEHDSLLSNLHEASSMLLSWFSKLEYTKVAQDVPLQDLERHTLQSSARVLALVESVERKFSTHECTDVRHAYAARRDAVEECHELIDAIILTAQHLVLLRRLVQGQDFLRVREVLDDHKVTVRRRVASSCSARSAKFQSEMLTGPYFTWLEQRWLPTMRLWRRIVLDARQLAATGDVEAAISRSQHEALAVPGLQDILRPGETISDLHNADVVRPIMQLAQTFEKKRDVMRSLRAALENPQGPALTKAIRMAHDFSRVKGGQAKFNDKEDEALISEAENVLKYLQQAEGVRHGLRAALQQGEGSSVVERRLYLQSVYKANDLLTRMGLVDGPGEAEASLKVMRQVSTLHGDTDSPPPEDMDAMLSALYLPHRVSSVWTRGDADLYNQVTGRLQEILAKELARRELKRALQDHEPSSVSGQVTPHRKEDESSSGRGTECTARSLSVVSSPMTGATVEELQRRLRQAEEAGVSGPLLEEAKAKLHRLHTIRLKVHFEAQTRIIPIEDGEAAAFDSVYAQLYAYCAEQAVTSVVEAGQKLRVRYEDSDGDFISILNDRDWRVMIEELKGHNTRRHSSGLRVDLYCDFFLVPTVAGATVAEPHAPLPVHAHEGEELDGKGAGNAAAATRLSPSALVAKNPTPLRRAGPSLNNAARLREARAHPRSLRSLSNPGRRAASPAARTAAADGGVRRAKQNQAPVVAHLTASNLVRSQTAQVFPVGEHPGGRVTASDDLSIPFRPSQESALDDDGAAVVRLNFENAKQWKRSDLSVLELQTMASECTRVSGVPGLASRNGGEFMQGWGLPPRPDPNWERPRRGTPTRPRPARRGADGEDDDGEPAAKHQDVLAMLNDMREENQRALRSSSAQRKPWY